ncbi:MAG: ABC transporter permease [Anaerolineae bacterium]|jgi:ABC-2 type transport system permease protein|nr:ABC transporter permease [Anaerolineae bacterium]MDH7474892.1 ABC transporter permease [Anaerolineae bacterium]
MTAFINHFAFEFKTGLRNPTLLLMNYLFPLGFYALVGLVMTQINPTFTETMLPAMVVFVAMVSTLLGLPGPLVESREAGVYRSYKINGVPALSILSIPMLSTLFHVFIVAAIISFTCAPFFGGAVPENWGYFVLITLVTAFTFGAIGALIGVVATGARSTVLYSQLIFLPSMLLGGLMVPLDYLPGSVRFFSALLPAAQAMEAYLGLAYNQMTLINPLVSVGILLVGGILAFVLAIYLFNWDSRNDIRRGNPLMALLALIPYIVGAFLMGSG